MAFGGGQCEDRGAGGDDGELLAGCRVLCRVSGSTFDHPHVPNEEGEAQRRWHSKGGGEGGLQAPQSGSGVHTASRGRRFLWGSERAVAAGSW